MFVVEALYPFSTAVFNQQQLAQLQKQQQIQGDQSQSADSSQSDFNRQVEKDQQPINKAGSSQQQMTKRSENQKESVLNQRDPTEANNQTSQITYLTFQKGDKILVMQTYQNGWWYGHSLKNPDIKGFFPSNYIQVSTKPKPPPPPPQQTLNQSGSEQAQKPEEYRGIDWVKNQLRNITQGPVKSDYYLGIKGYKNVKIDDNNQNILKGDHVRFDVSSGLARVPVKDQAPVAKAVRQMGYYFDYHQWNEQRNKNPSQKARPDPKKKKIKKLNLKGMK